MRFVVGEMLRGERMVTRNLLTDVPGLGVGNAEDAALMSGVTVVLPDAPVVASVDVRGGGPATAETDLLAPSATVPKIDAVVLSGGSAFGLDARGGAVSALAAMGRGFAVGSVKVPIVPAASLFDLTNGGDKSWNSKGDGRPPYFDLGRQALAAAQPEFVLGNAGAGMGGKAGALKGGLGSASWTLPDGVVVGALAAVNAMGSAVLPGTGGRFRAGMLERGDEFGGLSPPSAALSDLDDPEGTSEVPAPGNTAGQNTTLVVVATSADLSKAECHRLAVMAQDGLAIALRPVHSPLDGDTVFALSTARHGAPDLNGFTQIGRAAADCVARAVARAVWHGDCLGVYPSWRAQYGDKQFAT